MLVPSLSCSTCALESVSWDSRSLICSVAVLSSSSSLAMHSVLAFTSISLAVFTLAVSCVVDNAAVTAAAAAAANLSSLSLRFASRTTTRSSETTRFSSASAVSADFSSSSRLRAAIVLSKAFCLSVNSFCIVLTVSDASVLSFLYFVQSFFSLSTISALSFSFDLSFSSLGCFDWASFACASSVFTLEARSVFSRFSFIENFFNFVISSCCPSDFGTLDCLGLLSAGLSNKASHPFSNPGSEAFFGVETLFDPDEDRETVLGVSRIPFGEASSSTCVRCSASCIAFLATGLIALLMSSSIELTAFLIQSMMVKRR
eukprot:m.210477 g.210477  ORF g.210477 m.210477 type:complete len:316 (+) comp33079_c0_seq1:370-1317(+)